MRKFSEKLANVFAAITFAEAGELDAARTFLQEHHEPTRKIVENKWMSASQSGDPHSPLLPVR